MDHRFIAIYKDLVDSYHHPEGPPARQRQRHFQRARDVVTSAIDAAKAELPDGTSLRADGELFLIVSLHYMVALPLAQEDSPTPLVEIQEGLIEDTRRIMEAALDEDRRREDVPASNVMRGFSRVLDELHLKSWRIWERD